MQVLSFSYSGAEHSAIAIFSNDTTNDEAIDILRGWIHEIEQSDADVWPQ